MIPHSFSFRCEGLVALRPHFPLQSQACDESEFVMSSWVLCGKSIVNNSDKNLVDGQESSTFNVPEELLSLESRVAIDST